MTTQIPAIQMNSNTGYTGNITLPAPSGSQVALVNGIGSVQMQDVPIAMSAGWTVMAGQEKAWPPSQATYNQSFSIPGSWTISKSVTTPDGSTMTVTAGQSMQIQGSLVRWAISNGWRPTTPWADMYTGTFP